jgi:hypothetical protein
MLILFAFRVVPGQKEHLRLQIFEISTYTFANRFIFSPRIEDYTIFCTDNKQILLKEIFVYDKILLGDNYEAYSLS